MFGLICSNDVLTLNIIATTDMVVVVSQYATHGGMTFRLFTTGLWQTAMTRMPQEVNARLIASTTTRGTARKIADGQMQRPKGKTNQIFKKELN